MQPFAKPPVFARAMDFADEGGPMNRKQALASAYDFGLSTLNVDFQ